MVANQKAKSACFWGSLSTELHCRIFQSLNLYDKAACEEVCKSWRSVLASPQGGPFGPWGNVVLDFGGFLYETPRNALLAGAQQSTSLQHFVPLCSWLTARAPGMTSLDLAGMQEGFESYTSGWSREDADEDEVEDKKDRLLMAQGQQMAIFLPLLCGSLRGTSVRILVELAGRLANGTRGDCAGQPAERALLSDGPVMACLAEHISRLRITDLRACITSQDFSNICRLQSLTCLELSNLDLRTEAGAPEAGLKEISMLTNLQELSLDTAVYSPSWRLPPTLPHLQALTSVILTGVTSPLPALCALSNLRDVELFSSTGPLPDCKQIGSLSHLTRLRLQHLTLAGNLQSLSGLRSLKHLSLMSVKGQPDAGGTTLHLSHALAEMSVLEKLCMLDCSFQLEPSLLSRLTALTQLAYRFCRSEDEARPERLRSFHCCSSWQHLRYLSLSGNCLVQLPTNLSALTALVELDLRWQEADFQVSAPLEFPKLMPKLRLINLQQTETGRYQTGPEREWSASSLYYLMDGKAQLARLPVVMQF